MSADEIEGEERAVYVRGGHNGRGMIMMVITEDEAGQRYRSAHSSSHDASVLGI